MSICFTKNLRVLVVSIVCRVLTCAKLRHPRFVLISFRVLLLLCVSKLAEMKPAPEGVWYPYPSPNNKCGRVSLGYMPFQTEGSPNIPCVAYIWHFDLLCYVSSQLKSAHTKFASSVKLFTPLGLKPKTVKGMCKIEHGLQAHWLIWD